MKKKRRKRGATLASKADKFDLYERAVQNVDFEVGIMERFYYRIYKERPSSLKEDFCGTFSLCCSWVKRKPNYRAVGVDLDKIPLEWGRKRHLPQLAEEARRRITILQKNVLEVRRPKVDITAAFNFSYWNFQSRPELKNYFRNAWRSLNQKGILVLDAFGGSAAETEQEEVRSCDGFAYVWEQAAFYPLTREMTCRIHFQFRDGSRLQRSFLYHWRLWTPTEISELLKEAGFREVQWYFEGTDSKTGEGNGVFRRSARGENAETWIAYAVAIK